VRGGGGLELHVIFCTKERFLRQVKGGSFGTKCSQVYGGQRADERFAVSIADAISTTLIDTDTT
jgi:hypothetical protein